MPRFEPATNHFIVPEDTSIMTAAPFKPTRSHGRKKSNSVSALERLVVFTEATQRVKRRLRNVIAGAVGASTGRPKRKSRDIMHVDSVWNGWFETYGAAIASTSEPVPVPRQTTLPNFAPTINRYSVNMDSKSISDISMDLGESDDEGTSTPRANSPEPGTPTAAPAKEIKSNKTVEPEEEDEEDQEGDEDEGEHHESEDHEDHEEAPEEEVALTKVKSNETKTEAKAPSDAEDDAVSVFSPMDEDPVESVCTPKVASPVALPSKEIPKRSAKQSFSLDEHSDDKTPPLTTRTSSTDSTPPKTPKLTLQTNFTRTPVKNGSHFLTGMIEVYTTSPVGLGLDLEAEIHMFKALDLMDVILPSAISQEGDAPTYAVDKTAVEAHLADVEEVQKPALLPAVKLTEKKTSRKSSRRGSRASETEIIACSPRRAAIVAGKKNSKGSLNGAQDSISPTTILRAKIDSLPLEQDDSIPAWGVWPLRTSTPFFHQNNSDYSVNSFQTMRNPGDPQ